MGNSKQVRKKFLSDLEWHNVYQVFFRTTDLIDSYRIPREYENGRLIEGTIEDGISFNQRVAVDKGFFFPSEEPTILAWDIESITAGLSPDPYRDKIRSIGAWPSKFFENGRASAIKAFLKHIHTKNPDIITDYYGRFYDFPTLLAECKKLRIRCRLGRDGSTPYVLKRKYKKRKRVERENTIRIGGRIHFDVHKRADADYTLTLAGLKSRTLNEVSHHFGLDPISDMNHANIPEGRLEEVNLDDCRCTYGIAETYLKVEYALAELLGVPLNMIINRSPSHIANYIFGREYKKLDILSDGSNAERFPDFFKPKQRASQGAFIRCFRTGIFFDVIHKDYSSLYPSIIIAFNLSPETAKLIEVKEWTGEYRFEDHGNFAIIEVPDKVEEQFARQVIVRVDLTKDGVARVKLQEFLDKRREIKKQLKEKDDPKLEAQQNAYKVMANAIFGYMLMRYARYGNVLVGILTTAIGRYILKKTFDHDRERGNRIIECDTDGFYEVETKNEKEM